MKHFLPEEIDAFLDGRHNPLWRWWVARHIARCPQCQKLRDACVADRALLDELRRNTREQEAIALSMPATLVVAPSISLKRNQA